jgi:hypothetical protein
LDHSGYLRGALWVSDPRARTVFGARRTEHGTVTGYSSMASQPRSNRAGQHEGIA